MSSRICLLRFAACGIVVLLSYARVSLARESYWQGDTISDWNSANNWCTVNGASCVAFVPQASGGFNTRAVIGTDNANGALNSNAAPFGSPVIAAALPSPKDAIGGVYLGTRERNFLNSPPTFVNAAPAAGTLIGALTINAGTLNNITTTEATSGADGRIYVGQDGRGYLTMNGGTLTGTALVVGGEIINDVLGTSLVDLRGSSTLTISGSSTLGRRLRIQGPNVNYNSTGNVNLQSTNTYTAAITSPTAHSPIKADINGLLGGRLVVEYSGAAPAINQTWNLFDIGGGFDGGFTNVSADGDVEITGVPALALGEAYRIRQTTSGSRRLLQLVHDAVPVLRINRDTGELSVRNPLSGTINFEGYEIRSPLGSLISAYKGISGAPAGDSGWLKAPLNSSTGLGEVKQTGTLNLASIPSLSLGTGDPGKGFNKLAVASNIANFGTDGEDLQFYYSTPDGIVSGDIEYIGTKFENNLVVRVNPTTGQAFLKNDSLVTLTFDGYSILSSTGDLIGPSWSGGLGGTWQKSPGTVNALTETNLTGSTTLSPNQEIAIGDIGGFPTAASQAGLSMQFILAAALAPPAGDYNNNGIVDAADYVVWRSTGGTQAAYDTWRTNFGATNGPETASRVGSVVFDPPAAAGMSVSLAAVPEPATSWLMLTGLVGMVAAVRSRARLLSWQGAYAVAIRTTSGQLGGCDMWRRWGSSLVVAMSVSALVCITSPAGATTGGIPLANFDFALPGPVGTKVIAFDAMGAPIAGIIPGWTFDGPGVEDFGHLGILGDSGTEASGNLAVYGNDLILATLDGVSYQTATGSSIVNPPVNQAYKLGLDVHDIYTINGAGSQLTNAAELTARLYYGPSKTTLTSYLIHPTGTTTHVEFLIGHNDPLLVPAALGQTIGIEFDTTSIPYNANVAHSWVGVDNVVLEIAGTTPGDLNGDGAVNSTDYVSLRNNLQVRTPFEANGDLNNDNIVNLDDFHILKNLILAAPPATGTVAGSVTTEGVPEPSTAALALLAAVAFSGLFIRRRAGMSRLIRVSAVAAGGIAAFMSSASSSYADVLAYDPFLIGGSPAAGEYTTGYLDPTVAAGGGQNPTIGIPPIPSFFNGGWHRRTEGDAPRAAAQATGLSYLGSPAQGGSAYIDRISASPDVGNTSTNGRIGRSLLTPWTSSTIGTFYVSWVANFGAMGAGVSDMGYRGLEFWDETTMPNSGDADIGVGYSAYGGPPPPRTPDVARMFLGSPGGFQIISNAPQSFNEDGATHMVVFKFVLSDQTASDTVSVFLDPVTNQEPAIAGASFAGLNLAVGSIGFAMYGSDNSPVLTVDELRVATTFGEALPVLPIPGDTDGGIPPDVDIDDFNTIMNNFHRTGVTGGPSEGDVALANGKQGSDGRVGLADFWIWKRNRTAASGAVVFSGIPEPSTMVLVLAAAIFLAGCRRSQISGSRERLLCR